MTLTQPMEVDELACGCESGFATAISMAEAAADRNPAWWNEIRTGADDALDAAYCSSKLLGALLQSAAHRLGVPSADIWAHIRRTGELPLQITPDGQL